MRTGSKLSNRGKQVIEENYNSKTDPSVNPNKNRQNPHSDAMFNTLLIVGAIGSILISVFVSYKFHSLTVWSVFATFSAFLLAACLKWHGHLRWVFFIIFFIATLVGCLKWQSMIWNQGAGKTIVVKPESPRQVSRTSAVRESSRTSKIFPAAAKPKNETSPVKQTAYSRLDNRGLNSEVTNLVLKMNLYLEQKKNQDAKQSEFFRQQMREAKTEQEKKLVMEAETHNTVTMPSIDFEYDGKFKSDAVLLRDELLSRLPKDANKDRNYLYEHPGNTIGLQKIIDDLEMLAKRLPE